MSFVSSNFLKDLSGDIPSDASEISEVNSDDIDKIIKSATDLDKDVFGFDLPEEQEKVPSITKGKTQASSHSAAPVKTPRKKKIITSFEDPMADVSFSDEEAFMAATKTPISAPSTTNEDKAGKSKKIASLFGLDDGSPVKTKIKDKSENTKRSGDWLGLKDSPLRGKTGISESLISDQDNSRLIKGLSSAIQPLGDGLLTSAENSRLKLGGSVSAGTLKKDEMNASVPARGVKSSDGVVTVAGARPQSSAPSAKRISSSSHSIIEEILAQDQHLPSPAEKKFPKQKEPKTHDDTVVKGAADISVASPAGYEPSLGDTGRRRPASNSKRRDTHSAHTTLTSQPNEDIDWLLGPKQTKSLGDQKELTDNQRDTNLPEWLGGSGAPLKKPLSTVPPPSSTESHTQGKDERLKPSDPDIETVPEASKVSEETLKVQTSMVATADKVKDRDKVSTTRVGSGSVVLQLEALQSQLGEAMSRHQHNLQKYMKAIIQEAEIVESDQISRTIIHKDTTHTKDQTKVKEEDPIEKKELEKKREIEDLIHDLKLEIQRLEMQKSQLEMKIETIQASHKLQLSSLEEAHKYEVLLWEGRVERLQRISDDIQKELDMRMEKLKIREEEVIKTYKQRVETLQEERLADLKQLGEFHRLALEQATNLTVYYPHTKSGIKVPLRMPERPADTEELTEREKSLIEKERQLQVKEAELTALKEDLDDERENKRSKIEEKERELKRTLAEVKFREDLNNSEMKHEKRHVEMLKAEVERLKESAVKEQAQLSMDKLTLATEKAKLETALKLQQATGSNQNISNFDLLQGRAEVEAALAAAREAQEAALIEKRKAEQCRRDMEAITWQQQAKDQQLDNREKHILNILQESEIKREEGLRYFEEAKKLRSELLQKEEDIKRSQQQVESKEKEIVKERMELAKEKLELDKRKAQLELLLPDLTPSESLTINPPRNYIDPKVLIMKLKAEKELDSYYLPQHGARGIIQ